MVGNSGVAGGHVEWLVEWVQGPHSGISGVQPSWFCNATLLRLLQGGCLGHPGHTYTLEERIRLPGASWVLEGVQDVELVAEVEHVHEEDLEPQPAEQAAHPG